jgi:quinol monooxygenase YgiN/quercetin dioxygenase-like cupin family protein
LQAVTALKRQPAQDLAMSRVRLAAALALLAVTPGSAAGQDPVPLYPDNYTVLVENDRVRVMDFRLRKGDTERLHSHPAHVLYVLEPFTVKFTLGDGTVRTRQAKAGEVLFSEAVTHSPVNIGETDAHGILIELKQPPTRAASLGESVPSAEDLLTAVTFIWGAEGREDELRRELLTLTAPTRAEPGNLQYDLYQSAVQPNNFMRLEVWRNAAALDVHKATPHLQASFEQRKRQGWSTEITLWKRVAD